MSVHRALAPAKVNLGLFLGPRRAADGRHELVTVMQSISLADELTLEPAPPGATGDEVICPGVEEAGGENLAAAALRAFRQRTGWRSPPLRLSIHKRIPVAAGLGGGSADAAATLRLAHQASGLGEGALLLALAAELGADIPAQISPGRWLATGAGERLHALADPRSPFGLLVLPGAGGLSTAEVYAEADRLRAPRTMRALTEHRAQLASELLHNDLQRAAVSLCPEIAGALAQARDAGAERELVSGSGPTVVGLFAPAGPSAGNGPALAELAAASLRERVPRALYAKPVDAAFAAARTLDPAPSGAG